ncbi:hypothetical protein LDO31_18945 [Luteimonas sp. XNQY3]|nr:hypothetical protein [Luteimonas sp. XNQY3]MCD9008267.1 hypothetical protein [Luteimonas sp. XNQY3]
MEFVTNAFRAIVDETKGGQLEQLHVEGIQLLAGNGFWMHSSPSGAPDGSGLGYEMSRSDITVVADHGADRLTIEGRLCRSNGSGEFYGHRYRRSYRFHGSTIDVEHDCWVSAEDMQEAQSRWQNAPASFYVWAMPIDVVESLDHFRWNALRGWVFRAPDGTPWAHESPPPVWGRIPAPAPDADPPNNGWTTIPEFMSQPPSLLIYSRNGIGLMRELVDVGNVVQVNFWHNWPETRARTAEISMIGGDRQHITPGWPFLTPLNGGEVFKFKERIVVGRCDAVGNFTPF